MEDGGMSLQQFTQKMHKLIKLNLLDIDHWKNVVRIIFIQMIECIEYCHTKNICRFSVSLQNFVINDINIKINKNTRKFHLPLTDIKIKLCDVGTAIINNSVCKGNEKSVSVMNNATFIDAKKNDIWCVGVALFMLITGNARIDAQKFLNNLCTNHGGDINIKYVDDVLLDLFKIIFQNEIDSQRILQHSWIHG